MLEYVLDKRIEKMQISKSPLPNGISSSNSNVSAVIILNEDMRSRYMPPEPSVKILRRPTTNGCDVGSEAKPKQPIKTLQQREMEYAEARLRILGEAQSPEEVTLIEDRSDESDSSTGVKIQKIQTKTQILRPVESTCGIIRLPKGPDGTPGFNLRR